jgi:hypothetical protein
MALSTCTKCGEQPTGCGCESPYTTAPACLPVDPCSNPEPCSEFFDAECIIYSGDTIWCGTDQVVLKNDRLGTSIVNIVTYFCTQIATINSSLTTINTTLVSLQNQINALGGGSVNGNGNLNYVAKWTPNGSILGNSQIEDDANSVGIGGLEANSLLNLETSSKYRNLLITNTRTISGLGIQANISGASTTGNVGIWSNVYNSVKHNVAGLFRSVATITPIVSDYNLGIEATVGSTLGLSLGTNTAVRALVTSTGGITNPSNKAIQAIVSTVNTPNDNIGVYSEVKPFTGGGRYATQLIDGSEGIGKVLTCMTVDGKAQWVTPAGTGTNLQKEITATYVLTDADDNYVIFINNGATAITISVGAITTPNFSVGFIQEGSADVTFVGVTNPVGLKSKGQGYQTFVERKLSTSTYYLLGNTKV